MRVLVGIAHPKQVYMFKNVILEMQKQGHELLCVAIEKEITEYLLKQMGLPYVLIGANPVKAYKKLLNIPAWEYRTLKIAGKFKPDIYIGQALPHFAHVSKITRKPYIIFEDTESATMVQRITFPFATTVVTPQCYRSDIGKKQLRFNGYYELAYLHPKYFTPDPSILGQIGLSESDRFTIIRLVSWNALHDIGQKGFNILYIEDAVKRLETHGRVFISSESELPNSLKKYQITIPKTKIHDLLYYATMFIGDSGTMATEAGVLGTPSIRLSAFNKDMELGNFIELEQKYGLVFSYKDPDNVIEKALELLSQPYIKDEWYNKKKVLLNDTIDVNNFMINTIKHYSESYKRVSFNGE